MSVLRYLGLFCQAVSSEQAWPARLHCTSPFTWVLCQKRCNWFLSSLACSRCITVRLSRMVASYLNQLCTQLLMCQAVSLPCSDQKQGTTSTRTDRQRLICALKKLKDNFWWTIRSTQLILSLTWSRHGDLDNFSFSRISTLKSKRRSPSQSHHSTRMSQTLIISLKPS